MESLDREKTTKGSFPIMVVVWMKNKRHCIYQLNQRWKKVGLEWILQEVVLYLADVAMSLVTKEIFHHAADSQ